MLQSFKSRMKKMSCHKFLRRLMLHFDFLQDETSTMGNTWTIILLFCNIYLQTVPINDLYTPAIDLIFRSYDYSVIVFLGGLIVPSVTLIMMLVTLVVENKYVDVDMRMAEKPAHLDSLFYSIYKHVFRLNFFVVEPVLSGYMFGRIYPRLPGESEYIKYPMYYRICGCVGGGLGFVLSAAYLCFVESVLPSLSITSSTSRFNLGMTNMALRLCYFFDMCFVFLDSQTLLALCMCCRCTPLVLAMYFNLTDNHFFNMRARLIFVGFQVSVMIYNLTFYFTQAPSLQDLFIPVCLFVVLGLRMIANMEQQSRTSFANLSADKLVDVLSLVTYLTDKQRDSEGVATVGGVRFNGIMAYIGEGKLNQYDEFVEKLASTDEKINNVKHNSILLIIYLFERIWENSGERSFEVLIYETLFILTMRANLLHLSILLARMNALELNIVDQATRRAVIRRVEHFTKEIYLDQLSLLPVKEEWYAPKSVAEVNEVVALKHRLTIQDDDFSQKDGTENARHGDNHTIATTVGKARKSDLLHFDVYSSMQTIEQYERLVGKMQEVISTILKFYDKLKNRVVEIASAHETMKTVKQLKESVDQAFKKLNSEYGDQSIFHLLPYALFIDTINSDRQTSQALLKSYDSKAKLAHRTMGAGFRGRHSFLKFNIDLMTTLGVDCTKNSLGRMNYVSSNCEEVFGVQPKNFEGRNVNSLMSDDFQTIHDEFMDKFVKDQDKPYLGVSRERHVRIREQIYTKCDVLVKLAPVLNPTSLSFMCLLKRHTSDEEFIVLNHQGVIVGRSQGLDWADQFYKQRLHNLSLGLDQATINELKNMMARNNAARARATSVNSGGKHLDTAMSMEAFSPVTEVWTLKMTEAHSADNEAERPEQMIYDKNISLQPITFTRNGVRMCSDFLVNLKPKALDYIKYNERQQFRMDQVFLTMGPSPRVDSFANLSSTNRMISRFQPKPSYPPSGSMKMLSRDEGYSVNVVPIADPDTSLNPRVDTENVMLTPAEINQQRLNTQTQTSERSLMTPEQRVPKLFGGPSKKKSVSSSLSSSDKKPIHANAPFSRDASDALFNDIEAYTSMEGSTKKSDSKDSTKVRARIFATINHQKKYIIAKEIAAVVVLQLLIWASAIYGNILMGSNFSTDLGNFIDLREGFTSLYMGVSNGYLMGLTLMEWMAKDQGLIEFQKFAFVMPRPRRPPNIYYQVILQSYQSWYIHLAAHIGKFDYESSQQYLSKRSDYDYYYSENTETQKREKSLDMLDFMKELLYNANRWFERLNDEGTQLTFEDPIVRQYYYLMTVQKSAITTATIDALSENDVDQYSKVVSRVQIFVYASALAGMIFAGLCFAVLWMLRKKIIRIYSVLESMLPFEMELMLYKFGRLKSVLDDLKMSEVKMKQKVKMLMRHLDAGYQVCSSRHDLRRPFVRNRMDNFAWFGLGWIVLGLFLICLAYQATTYYIVNGLGTKLDQLLALQRNQQLMSTGIEAMSTINFLSYYASVSAANLGGPNFPSFQSVYKLMEDRHLILQNIISQLDNFVTNAKASSQNILLFENFFTSKPCDYMDLENLNMTETQCAAIGNDAFGTSLIASFRWTNIKVREFMAFFELTPTLANPFAPLENPDYLIFEFITRSFFYNFVSQFSTVFFIELKAYHYDVFVRPLRVLLPILYAVCAFLCLILTVCFTSYAINNIHTDLTVLLLLPVESYYNNSHVAAKLMSLIKNYKETTR